MVVLWKTKIAKNKIKNTSSSSTDILRISWQSLHLHLMATLGRHVGTTFRCVSTTWLQWCSWRSLHYCSSRVIWCNNHWVRHRGFVSIIQGPQQHESQRHGKDLSNAKGHAKETQHLQVLRPSNKTVDLGTTTLNQWSKQNMLNTKNIWCTCQNHSSECGTKYWLKPLCFSSGVVEQVQSYKQCIRL